MVWPLVIVQATTDVGFVILAASGLSFLGLGAQPPTPEWGVVIFESLTHEPSAWWLAVFPGGAIALVAIGWRAIDHRHAGAGRLRRCRRHAYAATLQARLAGFIHGSDGPTGRQACAIAGVSACSAERGSRITVSGSIWIQRSEPGA